MLQPSISEDNNLGDALSFYFSLIDHMNDSTIILHKKSIYLVCIANYC